MPKIPAIVGHQEVIAQLEADIESGNVSHAYLFTGPAHVGKRTVAFWLANKLLNPQAEESIEHHIEKLIHPDLLVLDKLWIDKQFDNWDEIAKHSNVPQDHRAKNSPAKTDTISINDIRELQNRLHETGTGERRVCIITRVERMNQEAANALLKILEEPPPNLTFILTTAALSKLLPTVVSRSRLVEFQTVSSKELMPLTADADATERKFILALAQGAPGLVKTFVEDKDLLRQHRQLYEGVKRFWEVDSLADRLAVLAPLKDRGEEAQTVLKYLGIALRQRPSAEVIKQALAYRELVSLLNTNAYRPLILQKFALNTRPKG